jgi:holin-like protein
MIYAIASLLALHLLGELVVRAFALPLPGALVGMLLLFAVLSWRGRTPAALTRVGGTLLRHMMLLLVPTLAGVMAHAQRVWSEGLPILAACVAGAALTLAVTAATLNWLLRRAARQRTGAGETVR